MALFKSSKKTQKTASEAADKAKPVVAATKTRTPPASAETPVQSAADAAPEKTRRKSASVVKADSALGSGVATSSKTVVPKTMAAAAGQAAPNQSETVHSSGKHALIDVPSSGHPAAHTNGFTHGSDRETIAQRAYFYWTERDFAHGFAEEDWARAEADLKHKN